MKISHLVFQEIAHRKLGFLIGLVSVAAAVACLVGGYTVLEAGDRHTETYLADQQQQLEERLDQQQQELNEELGRHEEAVRKAGKELEDEMRKITKGLGFNILILSEDQDLGDFHAVGTPTTTMPEEYVKRLANSRIVVINHLLPIVTRKLTWPETNRTIILTGTRGEVPLLHRKLKKPLQDLVPKGTIVLGHQLHTSLGLVPGDETKLMGKTFEVTTCYDERGSQDDITAWINLAEAQELLKMQNLVNAILALECNCATADRLAEIRKEIEGILPGTTVIEKGKPALARAEARNKAKQQAVAALNRQQLEATTLIKQEEAAGRKAVDDEKRKLKALKKHRQDLAAVLGGLAILGGAVWIGLLTLGNVRQRRHEIGILRAIGVGSRQVLVLFLSKALLLGLAGAVVGYLAGFVAGLALGDLGFSIETAGRLFFPWHLAMVLIAAPLLAAVAAWLPPLSAAMQDPAVVLQQE